ncbi:hypothetical protein IQ07DRAFT_592082 [Pyrenochaeta sp. DS3sAY3a]|nr:hypothetical protein IQ07DRAFT_592082 [Pyrenochaeta sp. DS3sAY3a]
MDTQSISQVSHRATNENFRHLPLNHNEPSIRLIHVLSTLSDCGHIQCVISHATVSEAIEGYTCLSYRWGDTSATRQILINGKLFGVRQNLYDFLHAVYTRASNENREMCGPYWIDALSINQANTVERNHQVSQMGEVFSNAMEVILWLGAMPPSLSSLVPIIHNASNSSYDEMGTVISNKKILNKHIIENQYWGRAWVTQEVVLARKVVVWLGYNMIDFKSMINGLKYFYLVDHGKAQTPNHFSQFVENWTTSLRSDKLIALVARFHNKACHTQHDRIYSLLSLCSEFDRPIKVDYDISRTQLAVQVLKQCPKSLCLCSAIVVAHTLGLHNLEPDSEELKHEDIPCLEIDVVPFSYKPQVTRWELYCFNYPGKIASTNSRNPLDFQDTCESSSLAEFRFSWDEDQTRHRNFVLWSHEKGKNSSIFEIGKQDGPRITAQSTNNEVISVRIPLWVLAKLTPPQPIELCRHAKESRIRRREYDTRYPRIVAYDDISDLPPLEANTPLPEHLARLEIKDSDSSDDGLENSSQTSSPYLSPWSSQERIQSLRDDDSDTKPLSRRSSALFDLDENDRKSILVYKYRSGAQGLQVTTEKDLTAELDKNPDLPFWRVTKKPIPRGAGRVEILAEDLMMPDEREKYRNKPTLKSSVANVGLPTMAYWKRVMLGSYQDLYIVSGPGKRNSRRRRMSNASESDSDMSDVVEAFNAHSKK